MDDPLSDNVRSKLEELPRMFNVSECRELLKDIYKITEKYYKKVEKLKTAILESENPIETRKCEKMIGKTIRKWSDEMTLYDVKVAGVWNVDFDSGDGIYYCWKYPEKDVYFFHTYEAEFKGRRPISLLEGNSKN